MIACNCHHHCHYFFPRKVLVKSATTMYLADMDQRRAIKTTLLLTIEIGSITWLERLRNRLRSLSPSPRDQKSFTVTVTVIVDAYDSCSQHSGLVIVSLFSVTKACMGCPSSGGLSDCFWDCSLSSRSCLDRTIRLYGSGTPWQLRRYRRSRAIQAGSAPVRGAEVLGCKFSFAMFFCSCGRGLSCWILSKSAVGQATSSWSRGYSFLSCR